MANWNNILLGTILAGFSLSNAAYAQEPLHLAQNSLVGQCRQLNQTTAVYETRGSSEAINTLPRGTEVLLDEPSVIAGRIYAILPNSMNGFVEASNLTMCNVDLPETPGVPVQPAFPGNPICINTRVSMAEGLAVRSLPSRDASALDRVYPAERISIIGETFFNVQTGTEWLQIDHPASGWIENGQPNTMLVNTSPCRAL
jgi:hypothetical protein